MPLISALGQRLFKAFNLELKVVPVLFAGSARGSVALRRGNLRQPIGVFFLLVMRSVQLEQEHCTLVFLRIGVHKILRFPLVYHQYFGLLFLVMLQVFKGPLALLSVQIVAGLA